MKVEVSEEGIVICDGIVCSLWLKYDTKCKECAIYKLFHLVNKYNYGI